MKVHFADEQDDPLEPGLIRNVAMAAMQSERLPHNTEVAITLIAEHAMAGLNDEHMGATGPTDVLSFPLEQLEPGTTPDVVAEGPPLFLGDIFICPTVVASNAKRDAVSFEDELSLMVVHGLLHLLGYDHKIDAEAEHMEERERNLLADLGRVRP